MKTGEVLQIPKIWKSLVLVFILALLLIAALHRADAKFEREIKQDGKTDLHLIYLKANTWSETIVLLDNRVRTYPDSATVEYKDVETGKITISGPSSHIRLPGVAMAQIRSTEDIRYIVERK